jgi:hypothetical protein
METASAASVSGPRCCCASTKGAYLAHNERLLEGLECDVSDVLSTLPGLFDFQPFDADLEIDRDVVKPADIYHPPPTQSVLADKNPRTQPNGCWQLCK